MYILNINRPPCQYFQFLAKKVLLKVVNPLKIYQNTFYGPTSSVQVKNLPQKFERRPFWKGCVEVNFNGITSLLNFIKIYQLVQKLGGGADTQTGW
jgi:hypothetical protein